MSIQELIGYLTYYADHGYGSGDVAVCDYNSNPITDSYCIKDALFIDAKGGDFYIVLRTE